MKQQRHMLVVAAGFILLLVLGCIACGQHGKQEGMMGAQSEKAQAQKAQAQAPKDTALVQDLISKNKNFSGCTGYNHKVIHHVQTGFDYRDRLAVLEAYVFEDFRLAKLLVDSGYLVPTREGAGWMPTPKLSFGPGQAIQEEHLEGPTWPGTEIRGLPCSVQSVRSLHPYSPPFPQYECDDVYRWTLVAGCREYHVHGCDNLPLGRSEGRFQLALEDYGHRDRRRIKRRAAAGRGVSHEDGDGAGHRQDKDGGVGCLPSHIIGMRKGTVFLMAWELWAKCKEPKGAWFKLPNTKGFSLSGGRLSYHGPPILVHCGHCNKIHTYSLKEIQLRQTSDHPEP